LIEQSLRGQHGGRLGLKCEVRRIITTSEQGNARTVEELDIVKRSADVYPGRPVQLPADYIERGRLRSVRHQSQYNRQHNLPHNKPFP
jgi:hypothetical protein